MRKKYPLRKKVAIFLPPSDYSIASTLRLYCTVPPRGLIVMLLCLCRLALRSGCYYSFRIQIVWYTHVLLARRGE